MKKFICCIVALSLGGCSWSQFSNGMQTLPPPSMETSIQPGQITIETHLNLQAIAARINSETYLMQRVDQGEGFTRVWGRTLQINSTQWGKEMKLRPSGWVIGARFRYNGGDWHEISKGDWRFGIDNARDNGQHPLEIQVTYEVWLRGEKTVGTAPLDPFWVSNMGD